MVYCIVRLRRNRQCVIPVILAISCLLSLSIIIGCTPVDNLSTPIVQKQPVIVITKEPNLSFIVTVPAPTITPIPLASPTFISTPTPTLKPTSTSTSVILSTATPTLESTCDCPVCSCSIDYVMIISIDGLRPDALMLADTPHLNALIQAGAYTNKAQTVLPSVTLINHASMLGGMSPLKHGITWNTYNANDERLINGPTLFSLAKQAGFSTAMVVGKPKLEQLVLPGSVDDYSYAGFTDQQVVDKVLLVIENGLPDILFVHLPDVDSLGHAMGWMHPNQIQTITATDALIGEIINSLERNNYLDNILLIVTSDHGGLGIKHGGQSPEEMTIPWLAIGPGIPAGLALETDITSYDTAATTLYALNIAIPSEWDGQPVVELFKR